MRIDFEKEPTGITITWGKVIAWIFGAGVLIVIMAVIFGTCNTAAKMVTNAQQTVYEQFSPSELLRKYEWFKDASAQLDAKVATISSYDGRFHSLKENYGKDSANRSRWDRDDKEQWNIWLSEQTGIKASYNDLAGQYNSAMSKFNYRFCNKGDLPAGAADPLPREYKPYITN